MCIVFYMRPSRKNMEYKIHGNVYRFYRIINNQFGII